MKVLVLNSRRTSPFSKQLAAFLSRPEEYRNQIYFEGEVDGILFESLLRRELPCGIYFTVDSAEAGCSLNITLARLFGRMEQAYVEMTNGIYYSSVLADERWKFRPFLYLRDWKYRKALVFRDGSLIATIRIPDGSSVDEVAYEYPGSDTILEVWCKEWEYFDRYLLGYWFEWGDTCLWGWNEKADEKYGYAIDIDKLPISQQTKNRIHEMSTWHDTFLDRFDPGFRETAETEEECRRFHRAASDLLEILRKELGDEYEIIPH